MKKSLLAAALTLATGGAIAQSSVTLYGNIDEGVTKQNSTVSISSPFLSSDIPLVSEKNNLFKHSNSSASYFGIKTHEDLGEGLAAKATVEFGFGEPTPDNQSAVHSLRQAWVSIGNNEGSSIKIGKIYSKNFEILSKSDASGSSNLAGSILYHRDKEVDSRQGIQYSYKQPTYGFDIGYFYDKTQVDDNVGYGTKDWNGKGYELSAHVDDGLIFGQVAYASGSKKRVSDFQNIEATRKLLTSNIGIKLGQDTKISYTFRHHKFEGPVPTVYFSDDGDVDIYPSQISFKNKSHQINFNHMATPKLEVFSSYTLGAIEPPDLVAVANTTGKTSGTGYQFGARYHFSKRTNMYAMYGLSNRKNTYYIEGQELVGLKEKNEAIAIGLKHMF